jgi:L-alanine-DL-glutamate epimerase-like enolase superfamily enzyme
VFIKVIRNEPGLYGIGTANNNYETKAMIAALDDHLKPWLTGKDPDRIEKKKSGAGEGDSNPCLQLGKLVVDCK